MVLACLVCQEAHVTCPVCSAALVIIQWVQPLVYTGLVSSCTDLCQALAMLMFYKAFKTGNIGSFTFADTLNAKGHSFCGRDTILHC